MKQTSLITTSVLRALAALVVVGLLGGGMNTVSAQTHQMMPSITGQYTPGSISGPVSGFMSAPTPANPNLGSASRNGSFGGGEFGSVPMNHSAPAINPMNQIFSPPQAAAGELNFPSTNAQSLKQSIGQENSVFAAPADAAAGIQQGNSYSAISNGAVDYGAGDVIASGAGCGYENFVVDEFQGSGIPMDYVQPGSVVGNPANSVNTIIGVSGLAFSRDYERSRLLSTGPANLFSRDANHGTMGGLDLNLARRRCNGKGWGVRYFQMFPNTASASVTPFPTTALVGLGALGVVGGATTQQVYDVGNFHAFTRDTEIHNLEFNLLRNGSQFMTKRNRPGVFEYLFGFRYFQFNEALNYESQTDNVGIYPGFPNPTRAVYLNSVENALLGGQVGTNYEIAIRNRLSLALGAKAGLYNNQVKTRQRVDYTSRTDGSISQPVVLAGTYAGQAFDEGAEKDDITFLGEFDLGLIYQIGRKARARVGYRAIGVSNVALAADQIQNDFSSLGVIKDADVDGNLLLHGGYFGLEFAY